MTFPRFARALLACALLGAAFSTAAQSTRPTALAANEVDLQFTRARNVDDLRRLCGPVAIDSNARACSFMERDGNGATCVIVALEPDSFNDMAKLVVFGRETWNCLAAQHAPQATGVRR